MATSLEKIGDAEAAPRNKTGLFSVLQKLVALYNALLNFKIIFTSGKNALTISEGNAVLELNFSSVVSVATKPDLSLSDASTPTAARLGFVNGTVDGVYPTGMAAGTAYSKPVSGSGVAWLAVTKDIDKSSATYGATTAVAIGVGSAQPPYTATGPFYIFLGDYSVVGGAVKVGAGAVGIGSLLTLYCGTSFHAWSV